MADSDPMATKQACEAALLQLAERLDGIPDAQKRRHSVDRTISCHLSDLRTTYSGRLCDGSLCDVSETVLPDAQIRLTVSSDDLVAVTEGTLSFGTAWTSGRLRIEASMLDMLRLRAAL
jgi:hypothetical protein